MRSAGARRPGIVILRYRLQRLHSLGLRAHGPLAEIGRRYIWSVPVVGVLGFLASGLEGLGLSLLIPFLMQLAGGGAAGLPAALSRPLALLEGYPQEVRLGIVAALVLTLVAIKTTVQYVNAAVTAFVDGRASHDIRVALANRLLSVPYPFFLRESAYRLLNIISTEAWRASAAIKAVFALITNAGAAAVLFLMLLFIEWRLALFAIFGVAILAVIQVRDVLKQKALSKAISESNFGLSERMERSIDAMRPIRVFGQEAREGAEFTVASELVTQAGLRSERFRAASTAVMETSYAGLFVLLLFGAHLSGIGLATSLTFLILLYRSQPTLKALGGGALGVAQTWGSVVEVEWLLSAEGVEPSPGVMPYTGLTRGIEFRKVGFAYERNRETQALRAASFTLPAGRTTALIGGSGSGKSTIVNLLCRLLDPSSGAILVDGVDLRQLDLRGWRARLGFAGQDNDLLDDDVTGNIRYGDTQASFEDVEAAARIADVHDFAMGLSEGYATRLKDRGQNLSGGQRQRIGLARALVRKPDFLILDEATNAVDGVSEAAILERLNAAPWPMTILVISHRASTLKYCDQGIVLRDGQVVEAGQLEGLAAYQLMVKQAGEQP